MVGDIFSLLGHFKIHRSFTYAYLFGIYVLFVVCQSSDAEQSQNRMLKIVLRLNKDKNKKKHILPDIRYCVFKFVSFFFL